MVISDEEGADFSSVNHASGHDLPVVPRQQAREASHSFPWLPTSEPQNAEPCNRERWGRTTVPRFPSKRDARGSSYLPLSFGCWDRSSSRSFAPGSPRLACCTRNGFTCSVVSWLSFGEE